MQPGPTPRGALGIPAQVFVALGILPLVLRAPHPSHPNLITSHGPLTRSTAPVFFVNLKYFTALASEALYHTTMFLLDIYANAIYITK